jgi:glutaminyl-tRNA synthetase
LRYGYIIRCDEVIRDPASGEVTELYCSYDAETGGGALPEGRKKVKGIIHWVSAAHAVPVEVRLYDRLLSVADPAAEKGRDYRELLNADSLEIIESALVEPDLTGAASGETFQFERLGYFCTDIQDSKPENLVFNRTVTLRDTWAKMAST